MANDPTYTRFYWRFIDEFPAIYDDKPTFGWWMTLLVIADGAHPAPAYLPRSVPTRVLSKLVDAGLVEMNGSDRFHVKGVAAERTRRSEAARVGGLVRGRSLSAEQTLSKRSPTAEQTVSLAEPSREKPSQAGETRASLEEDDEPEFPLLQWLAKHGCYVTPGNGYHRQLITAVERSGPAPILAMFEKLSRAGVQDGDVKGFVFGAVDAVKPKPNLKAIETEDVLAAERERSAKRQEATKRLVAEYEGYRNE